MNISPLEIATMENGITNLKNISKTTRMKFRQLEVALVTHYGLCFREGSISQNKQSINHTKIEELSSLFLIDKNKNKQKRGNTIAHNLTHDQCTQQ